MHSNPVVSACSLSSGLLQSLVRIWVMLGNMLYQFWLSGLTQFWLHKCSTPLSLSDTWSWMRSKVVTGRIRSSLLRYDWLMTCHATTPVPTMKSAFYLFDFLIIPRFSFTACEAFCAFHSLLCQVCVCVSVRVFSCVRELVLGGLWHWRRCLNYSFDVWALGAWDGQTDVTLLKLVLAMIIRKSNSCEVLMRFKTY